MAKIIKITFILLIISKILYAKILLEKDNIIITNLDVEIFLSSKYANMISTKNQTQIIKKIFLIKKMLNKIREKNPDYINSLDKKLNLDIKKTISFSDEILRYFTIEGDLINDYFINKLKQEDVTNALKLSNEMALTLSTNKCYTIDTAIKIKDIRNFDQSYFEKIKNPEYLITYKLNSKDYQICLDNFAIKEIELNLITIIEKRIEKDLFSYIYEK